MKYLSSAVVETYEVEGGFCVDIFWNEQEKIWEAWLYSKVRYVKGLMFGMPKQQGCQSKEDFIEIVNNKLDEYIDFYQEEYPEDFPEDDEEENPDDFPEE